MGTEARGHWGQREARVLLQQLKGDRLGEKKAALPGNVPSKYISDSSTKTDLATSAPASGRPPPSRSISLQSAANTCPASLFAGGRCPLLGGPWPRRKCFCLCSSARLPMLLGIRFPPPLFPHPHPPAHQPAVHTLMSHKDLRCPFCPKEIISALRRDIYHPQPL